MKRAAALAACAAFIAAPIRPCHVPKDLRDYGAEVSEAQLNLLTLDHAAPEQIAYAFRQPEGCTDGLADGFPCDRVDLVSFLPLSAIGGGTGNDLWGWTDPVTGTEYALVGRSNGLAFVDLSDPENPVYVGNLPTHSQSSSWRDVKVYADYAFIVADFAGKHGMQIFDLARLRSVTSPPALFTENVFYGSFDRAHNIVINEETGFAYAVGGDTCSGGLHMIDVRDPLKPVFAGCYSGDGYTHDAQCVVYAGSDVEHQGKELCFAANEDTLTIVDVSDKANPALVSRTGYAGSAYTHQGWLTPDHRYYVHDDELDELNFGHGTRTYLWDLADLETPMVSATYTSEGSSIDHNQYVTGGYTYQANYRRGLRILSVDGPAGELREVAHFDTYPEADGNDFDGAWSVYPFFASGVVLVSDINRGLFVLRPRLLEAIFADGFESGDLEPWTAPP